MTTHTFTTTHNTLPWQRLELIDPISNHAKFYVLWDVAGEYIAAYGRLGAKPQWTRGDSLSKILNDKMRKGYEITARGEIDVPLSWGDTLQSWDGGQRASVCAAMFDLTERSRSGAPSVFASQERPLSELVEQCQNLVSESVANPDAAMHTYAEIVGRAESAREDMETVESYLESLRLLLTSEV